MTVTTLAGVLLIGTPVWFNLWFTVLARRFDYPEVLRKSTDEIFERFRAGGPMLILTWWAFMASGGLLLASAVLLFLALGLETRTTSLSALVVGVLAGLVQVLGLLRWVYLVPELARIHGSTNSSIETRAAAAVTFRAFHHYFGVGVGEHLGYMLTGAWTALIGIVILRGDVVGSWLGFVAVVVGAGLIVVSAEFLGPNEEHGWALAGKSVPALYVGWSVWLFALGIAFLV